MKNRKDVLAKVKNYNLNVTEVRDSTLKKFSRNFQFPRRDPNQKIDTNCLVIKVIGRHPFNKQSVCCWVHNWFPRIEVKYTGTYNFENVEAAYKMIQNDLDLFKVSLHAHA